MRLTLPARRHLAVLVFPAPGLAALVTLALGLSGCVETLPIPEDFDPAEATRFAHLAVSGYDLRKAEVDGVPWSPPAGYTVVATYTTTQNWNDLSDTPEDVPVAWLGTRDDELEALDLEARSPTLYLTFRGTSTPTEALLDLNAQQVDFPLLSGDGGGTHKGFTDRYQDLHAAIAADVEVQLASHPSARIAITGHSLGGAVATLAAAALAEQTGVPVSCYTFASPRVGDRDFVARFEALVADSWRVTNPRDLVPGAPEDAPLGPDSPFAGLFYEHVGVRVDLPFDDREGAVETTLGPGANHSSCRYLHEVCELVLSDDACDAEVATHLSCATP